MKSFAVALAVLGSVLGGCNTTLLGVAFPSLEPTARITTTGCLAAPKLAMRTEVLAAMDREELFAFNLYKVWWVEHCKP